MAVAISCSTIIEQSGALLLVQEGNDPAGRFNLPGGGPKNRESLVDCAVREVREETNLEVSLDYLVGIYQCLRTEAQNNLTRFVFAASVVGGNLQPSEHHPTVDYFLYQDIKKLRDDGQLVNGGIMQAIKDYRHGRGVGLSTLTLVAKSRKHKGPTFQSSAV